MSDIIEFIAGESLAIGDIVNDDGTDTGVPFDNAFYCYIEAFDSKKKRIMPPINAIRADDGGSGAPMPFSTIIGPDYTDKWTGNVTVIVTILNQAPLHYKIDPETGNALLDSETNEPILNEMDDQNSTSTVVGKSKLYLKVEKFG